MLKGADAVLDGGAGDAVGDEDEAGGAVVAIRPGGQQRGRVQKVPDGVQGDGAVLAVEVEDALDA